MSAKLINYLRNDEELQQLRKQWKEVFPTEGFPLFNLDFYAGVDDYKQKIKDTIQSKDYSIIRDAVKLI